MMFMASLGSMNFFLPHGLHYCPTNHSNKEQWMQRFPSCSCRHEIMAVLFLTTSLSRISFLQENKFHHKGKPQISWPGQTTRVKKYSYHQNYYIGALPCSSIQVRGPQHTYAKFETTLNRTKWPHWSNPSVSKVWWSLVILIWASIKFYLWVWARGHSEGWSKLWNGLSPTWQCGRSLLVDAPAIMRVAVKSEGWRGRKERKDKIQQKWKDKFVQGHKFNRLSLPQDILNIHQLD